MEENRKTEIAEELETSNEEQETNTIEEETVQEVEIDPRIEKRDQLFENVKNELLEQDRLLKKFFDHSDEHCEFDYEEMGLSFEEEEDLIRRANKLKDKILDNIEEKLEIECLDRKIDTLHNMIITDTSFEEEKFRVIIEVFEDSFDLEIV